MHARARLYADFVQQAAAEALPEQHEESPPSPRDRQVSGSTDTPHDPFRPGMRYDYVTIQYTSITLSTYDGRVPKPGERLIRGGQRHAIAFHTPFHTLLRALGTGMEQPWRVTAPPEVAQGHIRISGHACVMCTT